MKWYGNVGYALTEQTKPGVWEEKIVVRPYYGDVLENRWRHQNSGEVNDDINISNQISIVADAYAGLHCSSIAYVEYMGAKWKVTDAKPSHPRLILTLGGVWNGK